MNPHFFTAPFFYGKMVESAERDGGPDSPIAGP